MTKMKFSSSILLMVNVHTKHAPSKKKAIAFTTTANESVTSTPTHNFPQYAAKAAFEFVL